MKQITTATIKQMKQNGEPITMVTAYDYAMAKNVCEAGIEMILVGDSLGNVVLGYNSTVPVTMDEMIYNSTVPVTMDEMIHHTKAVMRGAQGALVVGDMPFMSYQASVVDGMYNAARFLKETGCAAVKLEGGSEVCELVHKLTQAGIPVVGHIGLTPQSVNQLGGFKVQGKSAGTTPAHWSRQAHLPLCLNVCPKHWRQRLRKALKQRQLSASAQANTATGRCWYAMTF